MRTIEDILAEAPEPPEQLRLACGHDVPHAVGTEVFDYYDMRPEVIRLPARKTDAQPDTSGTLPNGIAWWVECERSSLDGSRMICRPCARRKGWL